MTLLRTFLCACVASGCWAQSPAELLKDATVRAALDLAEHNEPQAIDQEIKVCEIPAPPFHEEVRGHELKRLFDALALKRRSHRPRWKRDRRSAR